MKPKTVLSTFDGMSCVRIALEQLGIPIKQYFASEIDKYPIQITQKNYPDTIQLGDVTKVFAKNLPPIDILVGGSPCQGFSFAGDQLAFDDPRSALFFEFVRLIKECKPKYFLLENVRMKKEFLDVITEQLGVEPIFINSSLVSAQNRQRYYWTNIPNVQQPEDRGLVLKDILEDSDWFTDRDKSHCLDANYFKGGNLKSYFEKHRRQLVFNQQTSKGLTSSNACTHRKANRPRLQPCKAAIDSQRLRKTKHVGANSHHSNAKDYKQYPITTPKASATHNATKCSATA